MYIKTDYVSSSCTYLTKNKWYEVISVLNDYTVSIMGDNGQVLFINTNLSSHNGGSWERREETDCIIKSLRDSLKGATTEAKISRICKLVERELKGGINYES